MKIFSAFLIGGLFGIGIALSGMANPSKVLNFFDIAGTWDPSLIFVMGGALVTTAIGYRLVGIGWGIAGFCPGGAVPALGLGHPQTPIFLAAMIAGIVVARWVKTRMAKTAIA
jgi:hypothetical protein